MLFGMTGVGDAFQQKPDNIYINQDLCTGIAGDMIIWGEEDDGRDHDKYLARFLQIQESCGTTFCHMKQT